MRIHSLVLIGIALSTYGCASSQTLEKPTSASVAEDQARIKLTRESSFSGGGVNYKIKDGNVEIGILTNYGDGLTFDRPPGEPCISATSAMSSWKTYTICFAAPAGKVTNVQFKALRGFSISGFDTHVLFNEYCNGDTCKAVE